MKFWMNMTITVLMAASFLPLPTKANETKEIIERVGLASDSAALGEDLLAGTLKAELEGFDSRLGTLKKVELEAQHTIYTIKTFTLPVPAMPIGGADMNSIEWTLRIGEEEFTRQHIPPEVMTGQADEPQTFNKFGSASKDIAVYEFTDREDLQFFLKSNKPVLEVVSSEGNATTICELACADGTFSTDSDAVAIFNLKYTYVPANSLEKSR